MMRTNILLFLLLIIIMSAPGCVYAVRYDGPYKGKVIDAETKEPLEGVVILGVWTKEYPTPAGAVHKFYDAYETMTDKNGDFTVEGLGLKIMSNVIPMDVVIFKAGYEHLGYMSWLSLKEDILLSKRIKWEGEKAIIPLKKLMMEERKRQIDAFSIPGTAPKAKVILMLKEIDKDLMELGLEPFREKSWR